MVWEIATALAGDLLEVDAFDQPGVEAAKDATYALMGQRGYEDAAEKIRAELGQAAAPVLLMRPETLATMARRKKARGARRSKRMLVAEDRLNETSLLAKARAHDQRAFGLLVSRYEKALLAVLLPIAGDRERAQDLVQDTFLRAYERLDQYVETHRFSTWLFRIGINLAISFRRRLKIEQRTLEEARACPDAGQDRAPQPIEDLARKEEATALRAAIGRLPERYQMRHSPALLRRA